MLGHRLRSLQYVIAMLLWTLDMQYRDENRTMIVIVSASGCVSVCIYCIYRVLCMLVSGVSVSYFDFCTMYDTCFAK